MSDWAKLKVVDLKAELKRRDLPQSGVKADLVARLEETDQAGEKEEPATEAQDVNGEKQDEAQVANGEQDHPEDAPATSAQEEAKPETTGDVKPVEETQGYEAVESAPEPASEPRPEIETKPGPETKTEAELETETEPLPTEAIADREVEVAPEAQPEPEAMAVDSPTADVQRKKRSLSPPPDEESVAKRARIAEQPSADDAAPAVHMAEDAPQKKTPEDDRMEDVHEAPATEAPPSPKPAEKEEDYVEEDYGRDVAPAKHRPTRALYIANLMRPLRPTDIQAHLVDLATPRGVTLSNDIITTFHLDQLRTHALVVFTSTAAAARVRALLHDIVWPDERNRKALWLDFIPPEKVEEWIDKEAGDGRGRSSTRWEVVYADAPDGGVEARLEVVTGNLSRAPPSAPTGPRVDAFSSNDVPLGPRGNGRQPPTGPRPKPSGPGPRPTYGSKWTTAFPSLSYIPASEDMARSRLSNMRSYYTDRPGPHGREINRYSFEEGDLFVDRGKEVFEGIRPPHRERGGRGGRGGGFRGRGGGSRGWRPRPRSDRYEPPARGNFRYDDQY